MSVRNPKWEETENKAAKIVGLHQPNLARLRTENRIPRGYYREIRKISSVCRMYDMNRLISLVKEMRKNGELKKRRSCKRKEI